MASGSWRGIGSPAGSCISARFRVPGGYEWMIMQGFIPEGFGDAD